jgi:predicted Rossmann fold flavoprotein
VLRNVRATAFRGTASSVDVAWIPALTYGRGEKKTPRPPVIESRLGEMLFTHFGLGGPMILQLSLAVVQALREGPVSILIDLKPAVPRQELRKRLMSDLNQFGKRPISIILKDYLPSKMIFPLTVLAKVDPSKPAHQISAAEREKLLDVLKALRFNIQSSLPLAQAIVTAGGVALDEIDPRTLASKKVSGLFFCGEILDLDADTGGYNLQAAFSTGYVAGESAARYLQS